MGCSSKGIRPIVCPLDAGMALGFSRRLRKRINIATLA
jgi:hypothetical protein